MDDLIESVLEVHRNQIAETGRSCGDCSLCCKLVEVAVLNKPEGKWCIHCRPRCGGCAIYDQRPLDCKTWFCCWLLTSELKDYWRPNRSKMVIGPSNWSSNHGMMWRTIYVDPAYPNRWREEPYYSDIKEFARVGLNESTPKVLTAITCGKTQILILPPNKEVDIRDIEWWMLMQKGNDWDVVKCKTEEDGKSLELFFNNAKRLAEVLPIEQRVVYKNEILNEAARLAQSGVKL